jgi:arsenate reductase
MPRVLFVCAHNTARSQMAEGLFNALAPAGWTAVSAGTDPQPMVRPEAIAALREIGIDIGHHRPKTIAEAMSPDVRLVIGVCAEAACPVIPGIPSLHWPLPDPTGQPYAAFCEARDALRERIRALVRTLTEEER